MKQYQTCTVVIAITMTLSACRSGAPPELSQESEPAKVAHDSAAKKDDGSSTGETKVMTDEVSALLAKLDDPDEQVRVDAALALHARKHPKAIEACVRTIDDGADELHLDRTPAVRCLIELGMPALIPLLDVLLASNEMTRLRAQRAVEEITLAHPEFHAPSRQSREAKWRSWWRAMGYAYDAEQSQRQAAVKRLRAWAEAHNQTDPSGPVK